MCFIVLVWNQISNASEVFLQIKCSSLGKIVVKPSIWLLLDLKSILSCCFYIYMWF